MSSVFIIILLEIDEFRPQINRRPEQRPVEVLPADRADQALYEGMRKRNVRNCFDFLYFEYSKISLLATESIQRIMIRAEVFW